MEVLRQLPFTKLLLRLVGNRNLQWTSSPPQIGGLFCSIMRLVLRLLMELLVCWRVTLLFFRFKHLLRHSRLVNREVLCPLGHCLRELYGLYCADRQSAKLTGTR